MSAPSLKHTSCRVPWAFQSCGSNTVIVQHNGARPAHHRHISSYLLDPAPGSPQLCASTYPALINKKVAMHLALQKHFTYRSAPRKSNPAANLFTSSYFSVAWHGKQRRGRTEELFFSPFEGLPLKMDGPLIRWKEGWDWDHLPDGDRQREALTGPS